MIRQVHDRQKGYLDSIFGKLVLSDYLHTHIAWWCNIFSTVTLRWLTVFIIIPVNACVYACVCVCEEKEREKREEYVLRKLKCWGNNKREKLHLMPEVTESISIFG